MKIRLSDNSETESIYNGSSLTTSANTCIDNSLMVHKDKDPPVFIDGEVNASGVRHWNESSTSTKVRRYQLGGKLPDVNINSSLAGRTRIMVGAHLNTGKNTIALTLS